MNKTKPKTQTKQDIEDELMQARLRKLDLAAIQVTAALIHEHGVTGDSTWIAIKVLGALIGSYVQPEHFEACLKDTTEEVADLARQTLALRLKVEGGL